MPAARSVLTDSVRDFVRFGCLRADKEVPLAQQPFAELRGFLRRYQLHCKRRGIVPIDDATVEKRLVSELGCEVIQLIVRRVSGLRWRRPGEALMSEARAKSHVGCPADADALTVQAFVRAHCVCETGAFLDFESRPLPDGTLGVGFRVRLFAWCREEGRAPPDLRGTAWAAALPATARFRDRLRVKQLRGISFPVDRNGHVTMPPLPVWLLGGCVTVAVHFAAFVAPPLLLCWHALAAQDRFGTTGAAGTWEAERLTFADFSPTSLPLFGARRSMMPLTQLVVYEGVAFLLLILLAMVAHYLERPSRPRHRRLYKKLLSALLTVHTAFLVLVASFIGAWLIFAGLMVPEKLLPAAMGVRSTVHTVLAPTPFVVHVRGTSGWLCSKA